ncbi:hypothetical protein MTO96_052131, partial [Rhipicephalus appendiculatus]
MQWVEIDAAEARQDRIPGGDEYLQIMVSQMQEKLAKMKPRGSTAAAQPPARKTGSTLAACAESPRQLASWRPTRTPRIRSDELVEITLEGPAEHGCQPKCLICGENHFTGSAQCVGKFRKAWKPAPSQPQHGLKSKQGGPPTPPTTGAKAQPKQNKPRPSNVPAGQKSKPPTFQAGDFPSLSSSHKQ